MVVIAIPSNHQTYTLQHTTLHDLHLSNIVANDASTIGEWTSVLGDAPPVTPPSPPPPPVTPAPPPPVVSPGDASPWSASAVYTAGMTVMENGITYKAIAYGRPQEVAGARTSIGIPLTNLRCHQYVSRTGWQDRAPGPYPEPTQKRLPMKLTAATVRSLTLPEGLSDKIFFDDDLPRFGVRVRAGGSRTWVIQYGIGGREKKLPLGSVTALDPGKARSLAKDLLARVRLGEDPLEIGRAHV